MEKDIIKKMHEKELNFLKGEIEKINTQIKARRYSGNLKEITRLWELRKNIVDEMTAELHKEEFSFLTDELERTDTQIKAYKYSGQEVMVKLLAGLFKLRKIIVEEINNIIKEDM